MTKYFIINYIICIIYKDENAELLFRLATVIPLHLPMWTIARSRLGMERKNSIACRRSRLPVVMCCTRIYFSCSDRRKTELSLRRNSIVTLRSSLFYYYAFSGCSRNDDEQWYKCCIIHRVQRCIHFSKIFPVLLLLPSVLLLLHSLLSKFFLSICSQRNLFFDYSEILFVSYSIQHNVIFEWLVVAIDKITRSLS